jgi:hypothetical protein
MHAGIGLENVSQPDGIAVIDVNGASQLDHLPAFVAVNRRFLGIINMKMGACGGTIKAGMSPVDVHNTPVILNESYA